MRQIVLDTETTGLEPSEGHRVIEIGALEMIDRRLTGNNLHLYINPEREVEEGALAVHGITNEFLNERPLFAELAEEFLDFIEGAELVIHNAAFDIGFLNAELARLDAPTSMAEHVTVLDTLALARELHPGQRVSLDALCKRYEVDNSGRQLHGALLDAQLLAEVYLAMTGGQKDLVLEMRPTSEAAELAAGGSIDADELLVRLPDAEELLAHQAYLDGLEQASGERCLWLELIREGRLTH